MTNKLGTREFTLDDVFRHAVDGMFVIDQEREVVSLSEGCKRILGTAAGSTADALGTCHELMGCRDEHDRSFARSLCAGSGVLSGRVPSARQRMSVRHENGRRLWVDTTYSPIYNESGRITHVVGIMRDITETKMREDELREAAARGAACSAYDTALTPDGPGSGWTEGSQAPSTEGIGNMGPLDQILTTIERREIVAALKRANGQRTLAARLLGISRSRLYRRMEALGIDPRGLAEAGEAPPRQDG